MTVLKSKRLEKEISVIWERLIMSFSLWLNLITNSRRAVTADMFYRFAQCWFKSERQINQMHHFPLFNQTFVCGLAFQPKVKHSWEMIQTDVNYSESQRTGSTGELKENWNTGSLCHVEIVSNINRFNLANLVWKPNLVHAEVMLFFVLQRSKVGRLYWPSAIGRAFHRLFL